MFSIQRYSSEDQQEWDEFIASSKNGTFLFERAYMDYHSDRFMDHSLLFRNDKGMLMAVLPANISGKVLYSHQGLTFGGLVMSMRLSASATVTLFAELRDWLKAQGIERLVYKPVPHIYCRYPAEEDLYALFRMGGVALEARSISSVIPAVKPAKWSHGRIQSARLAQREGIIVEESEDFSTFWTILEENLMTNHGVRPVHTIDEIKLLHSRFPHRIRLYVARKDEEMLGGTVLYDFGKVLHTQYISSTPRGKKSHALDAIFHFLLQDSDLLGGDCSYFEFGISNEDGGKFLNESLIFQKESFGGRGLCLDTLVCQLA